MKMNYRLILGLTLTVATAASAQTSTNSLPPIPAPIVAAPIMPPAPAASTNTPATKPAVKHHHKKTEAKATPKASKKVVEKKSAVAKTEAAALSEASITLVPGAATVAVSNLNVRGQAGLKGEVVAHLQKGDAVTVLSEISLDKHKADEPSQWAKIALPSSVSVWVDSSFIDAKDKTVKPKKLNLRAGPSEDYSVLGVVEHGTVVNEIGAKGNWTKIEAPANSYAFIAAMYLSQAASGNTPTNFAPSTETTTPQVPMPPVETAPETTPANVPPATTTVPEAPPIISQPQPAPAPEINPVPPAPENNTNVTMVVDPNVPPVIDPNAPRIVTHEGRVRSSISLVAPTYYELYNPTTMVPVDYLHSSTTNLNLALYNGFQIIVTGQEAMDARWKDTPVLTVQKIYVVDTNTPSTKVYYSPRASQNH
jgi:uncharacterized protein YgiM (DUF1202 family)